MVEMSTNAAMAANAARQLERNNQEIADIAERARGYQTELEEISGQRVQLQTKRDDLVRMLAAAAADRERASLAYDVAMNTSAEAEKQQVLADVDALMDALQGDILAIDTQYAVNDGFLEWSVREKALKGFVQDCHKERDKLLGKRAQLEELHNEAHERHGQEVYRAAAAELAQREAEVQQSRATLAGQEQALAELRASMLSKFTNWPALQNEVNIVHQEPPDDAASHCLAAADHYLAVLETELPRLPFYGNRDIDIIVGSYHLWRLLAIPEASKAHYHLHANTPAERWTVPHIGTMRNAIATALAEHDRGNRHVTTKELARIETKLRELATVTTE